MHRRLKRKFALFCAGLTSIVLFAALFLSYLLSKSQLQIQADSVFTYQSQVIEHSILKENHIDHATIRDYERDFNMFIYLYDNGNYVDVMGGGNHEEKSELRGAAESEIERILVDGNVLDSPPDVYLNRDFSISNSEGLHYRGRIIFEPITSNSWYSLIVLSPNEYPYEETQLLLWRYAFLFVGLMVVLLVISWFLASRSVKPVEIAGRKQKEFIAAASHELKNPLAVISASAQYLQNDKDISVYPKVTKHLDIISDEAKQMARLVDDLLLLSNIEANHVLVKNEIVDTEGILIAAYDRFSVLAHKTNHPIRLELPDEPLFKIETDADRILQILLILLSNAAEHTVSGTKIELVGRNEGKQVIISVVDHGNGITDGEKKKIFERFYQVDNSHTKKNNFGLGLSIAQKLAEAQHVSIWVEDTPGGGATFVLKLKKM